MKRVRKVNFNYKKTKVSHNGREYIICFPSYDFQDTYITELGKNDFYFFSSKEDFFELSKVFEYIAKKQDTILYIPCRNKNHPFLSKNTFPLVPIGVDLVCVSHTLQFKQKEWKSIRSKLKNNPVNHNIQTDTNYSKNKDLWEFNYKESKDYIDIYMNFSTLILTGSTEAFNSMSEISLKVSDWEYDTSGLAHHHLSHIFKWSDKYKEFREITFSLVDPSDSV